MHDSSYRLDDSTRPVGKVQEERSTCRHGGRALWRKCAKLVGLKMLFSLYKTRCQTWGRDFMCVIDLTLATNDSAVPPAASGGRSSEKAPGFMSACFTENNLQCGSFVANLAALRVKVRRCGSFVT